MSNYTKFIWISNNVDEKIRGKIQSFFLNRLSELFDWVIKRYYEMPIGYSENAFTGYMAQAAYNIGWYAIVDYVDRPENENKRTYRPDLFLAIKKEQEVSIVFEVKKEWISLDSHQKTVFNRMKNTFLEAYYQLDNHKNENEATHQCALSVLYLYCSDRRWEQLKKKQDYHDGILNLSKTISGVINDITNETLKPNFFYQFLLDRDNPDHNRLFKLKGDEKPLLGCIISGMIWPKKLTNNSVAKHE